MKHFLHVIRRSKFRLLDRFFEKTRFQLLPGQAIVQKIHIEIENLCAPEIHAPPRRCRKPANDGGLDAALVHQSDEGIALLRRNGERHSFLRFAYPYLPRSQPGVLQRHRIEINLETAGLLRHLRNRAREPPGAVIGNRRIQSHIARLFHDSVGELLLRDRIANLHRCRRAPRREGFR